MTLIQYIKMALRLGRRARGTITLFIACIAVGVAAVVIVAGISNSVTRGVVTEGRRLLAADVVVQGRRPAPAELQDITSQFDAKVQQGQVKEFISVLLGEQESFTLAEVKVVDGTYPFYGKLVVEPEQPLMELLTEDSVVVAPELLVRLYAKVGDEISLGGSKFKIAGVVTQEPDKLTISFSMGPRVFMSDAGLARTSLIGMGSRVTYRTMLKLGDDADEKTARRLKNSIQSKLPDAEYYSVKTFTEAQPSLRKGFERIGRYLGLVGVLSLLIGCLGVAQVSRVWLAGRMDDIAIFRCLGMTAKQVVGLFMAQILALAMVASVIGALVGTAVLATLPWLAADVLPVDLLDPWQPAAVIRGLLMGLATAMAAVSPLLVNLRNVPPVRVFRRDVPMDRATWRWAGAVTTLILTTIWLIAWVQVEAAWHALIFIGGLTAVTAVLWVSSMLVSRAARLLPRDAGGLHLRHGLSHLARPGAATLGAIVAVGLGVSFLFTTYLVQQRLAEQLHTELPADAPSTFFVDVQPPQWTELEKLLTTNGATGVKAQPIITARFDEIDGVPVRDMLPKAPENAGENQDSQDQQGGPEERGRSRRWALSREQRLTYGSSLPEGNKIIQGTFNTPGRNPGVSVEESFAKDINVKLGSIITLDVQGVPVELTVTSIRRVDWRTFGINFFLFAEPGPLDLAPQMLVAVARIPEEKVHQTQLDVVRTFPNVTLIHIRDVMDKILVILTSLSLAVRGLGFFALASGLVVLGGTIAATQATRAREVALLKTIGMTRMDVMLVFAIEYALTGMVAAMVGIASGTLLAWATLVKLMELPWSFPLVPGVVAVGATVALSVVVGLLASGRALASKPIIMLQSQA